MTVEGQTVSNNRAYSISVPGPNQGLCNPCSEKISQYGARGPTFWVWILMFSIQSPRFFCVSNWIGSHFLVQMLSSVPVHTCCAFWLQCDTALVCFISPWGSSITIMRQNRRNLLFLQWRVAFRVTKVCFSETVQSETSPCEDILRETQTQPRTTVQPSGILTSCTSALFG